MEHRWGERVAVSLTVELSSGASPPVAGWLENVSSSGAFVRTESRGPPRGPIEVILPQSGPDRGRPVRLAAYVVRETDAGVGIEWREFAPRPVRELVISDRRAGSERARAHALPRTRHWARGPNTAMQPRSQPA
ncbi:MAG: PilZ domain-containing protein [Steroidobacteraceae bacterium]